MALSAAIQFDVRQGGSDTNGGGFKAGATGTDFSQQNAAQYSVTDGVTAGTTTITSATANFGTDVVGNVIYVQGGTGAVVPGWYEITVRNSATSITVDRSTGLTSGTGVTLHIGGAFATPGQAAAVATISGHAIWWQYNASTYNMTTATAGAGGPISLASAVQVTIEGYDVTRGDRTGNKPKLSWASVAAPGSLAYMAIGNGNSRQGFLNCILDGNSVANVGGFNIANARYFTEACEVRNCNQSRAIAFNTAVSTECIQCRSDTCTTGFTGGGNLDYCEAIAGTTGFVVATGTATNCLARGMATGFSSASNGGALERCTADACTTAGFDVQGNVNLVNCLATNCTGSGTGYKTTTGNTLLTNCAHWNNTTAISGTPIINRGVIALSADPYVNQAGADFRPNTTAGGGASLRNAGIGVYGQTDNSDIGAVQHTDPAGGGGNLIVCVEC